LKTALNDSYSGSEMARNRDKRVIGILKEPFMIYTHGARWRVVETKATKATLVKEKTLVFQKSL